jgi:hypothetical protein
LALAASDGMYQRRCSGFAFIVLLTLTLAPDPEVSPGLDLAVVLQCGITVHEEFVPLALRQLGSLELFSAPNTLSHTLAERVLLRPGLGAS